MLTSNLKYRVTPPMMVSNELTRMCIKTEYGLILKSFPEGTEGHSGKTSHGSRYLARGSNSGPSKTSQNC